MMEVKFYELVGQLRIEGKLHEFFQDLLIESDDTVVVWMRAKEAAQLATKINQTLFDMEKEKCKTCLDK